MTTPDLDTVRHGYAPEGGLQEDPPADVPLRALAADLIGDIRATIAAEQNLFSARMALFGDGAKRASLWGTIAVSLAFLAVMALVFGGILMLSARIGPELATLIICVILLAGAALAALAARGGARDAATAFKPTQENVPGPGDV